MFANDLHQPQIDKVVAESKSLRRDVRATQAILLMAKSAFMAEVLTLKARTLTSIQRSRELLDKRIPNG